VIPHCAPETAASTALEIRGGTPLAGATVVDGSKNAALPLLAAAACLQQQVELRGVAACADVEAMLSLLRRLGWAVSLRQDLSQVTVGAVHLPGWQPDLANAAAIRASYYLVAPLITAYGGARLPWPGGCSVGDRGMELHFAVYEAFGDHVGSGTGGYTVRAASGGRSESGTVHITLPFRSRGATVAALLRAVVGARPVVIGNANLSAELHVLYRALSAAGCEVQVDTQQVSLWPGRPGGRTRWLVPGDKIEAGTLACAIAATGGRGHVDGALTEDIVPLVKALALLGVPATCTSTGQSGGGRLMVEGPAQPTGGSLRALASLAPGGLDADWEPGLMALALGLPGEHSFADEINPGRHGNLIPQLRKLGAVITETSLTECRLIGPQSLTGATVEAIDIRTGSALLIAALAATSVLTGLSQLRRGHADLPGKLAALGAQLRVRGQM
jgi:UDP-N-acetylglucosamine 1-carboxyvinyltransferase